MLKAFNTLVRPAQIELEQALGIKKIEVKGDSKEQKAAYRFKIYKDGEQVGTILQFDPLGYTTFNESRK